MDTDDTLGNAVTEGGRAISAMVDAWHTLSSEVLTERAMHQGERERLLQRAEHAEAKVARLQQLLDEQIRPELPKRVDPRGCGCTDCLTGYSIPAELALHGTYGRQIAAGLALGEIQDARQ